MKTTGFENDWTGRAQEGIVQPDDTAGTVRFLFFLFSCPFLGACLQTEWPVRALFFQEAIPNPLLEWAPLPSELRQLIHFSGTGLVVYLGGELGRPQPRG